MRKYLIGVLCGLVLSFTGSVYAEEIKTMVGKVIDGEFPITVNSTVIEKKALVIEGVAYLPVRAMGEALGADISFDENLGVKVKTNETVTDTSSLEAEKLKLQEEIGQLKREKRAEDLRSHQNQLDSEELIVKQNRLKGLEDEIKTYQEEAVVTKTQKVIDALKAEILDLKTKLAK